MQETSERQPAMTPQYQDERADYTNRTIALVGAFLVIRLVLSAFFPATIDEAYAIVVSRVPSLSYYDHPLLGFGLSRAFMWLFGSEAMFVARLPHVLSGSLTALLLWRVTLRLFGSPAAFWAVAWYTVAPFFFISAGHFVVPDGPLDLFLMAALWLALPLFDDGPPPYPALRWLAVGLALGLAFLSKYQAVLFVAGAFLFLVISPTGRRQLRTIGPWIAAIVALAFLAPIIAWNIQHDWASVTFQSARARSDFSLQPLNFVVTQLGQMVYLLPGTWLAAILLTSRELVRPRTASTLLLAIVTAIPVVVFDAIALVTRASLPHWPMSGFLFAFPLIGDWSVKAVRDYRRLYLFLFRAAVIGVPAAAFVFAAHANYAIFTRPFFEAAPHNDVAWPLLEWDALPESFEKRGIDLAADGFLLPASWSSGAKAAYALGPDVPVAVPVVDPRHFAFMDDPRLAGRNRGYVVLPARLEEARKALDEASARVFPGYAHDGAGWIVTQTRGGFPAFAIVVVPVKPD